MAPALTHETRAIPLVWAGVEDLVPQVVNQLLVQVDLAKSAPDAVLLTAGFASAPPVTGTPDEQAAALARVKEVVVRPVVKLVLTRARLQEWIEVLSRTAEKFDTWPVAMEDDAKEE